MSDSLTMQMRPRTFDQFLGNEQAIKLAATLTRGAVLIHGPFGCGKTSLATLIAERVYGAPLPVCGSAIGGVGIFAAYLLGQDVRTRFVKELVRFTGRRVVVIDEAQQLSFAMQEQFHPIIDVDWQGVQNLVIFCTTDLREMGAPLRSRCIPIPLGPLSDAHREELVESAYHARTGSHTPPRDLLPALKRASISIPRMILRVVELVVDLKMSPQDAVAAVAAAVRA